VPEKLAPGYYFVAPYQQIQESVHIYDNNAVSGNPWRSGDKGGVI